MSATAAIFGGLSALSSVMGAAGQLQQGKATQDAMDFKARVQEQQAEQERQAAAAEAADFRRRGSRQRAASLARLSGSGAGLAGSPMLVDESLVKDIALGSSRIGQQGQVRGSRLEQQASLSRAQGRSARAASRIGAGASLLGGGASILSGIQRFG